MYHAQGLLAERRDHRTCGVGPPHGEQSHERAMRAILSDVFAPFGSAQGQIVQLILDAIELEKDLLIYGKVNGKLPSTVHTAPIIQLFILK